MKISIYIRHRESGASYYRIFQYCRLLEASNIKYRVNEFNIELFHGLIRRFDNVKLMRIVLGFVIYLLGTIRRVIQLSYDVYIYKPDIVFVQREIFPRYVPHGIRLLLRQAALATEVIWDFDDNILFTQEISDNESLIYQRYAKHIVVPNDYLKTLLPREIRRKITLIPTTDSDLLSLNVTALTNKRLETFKSEVRVIWLGTYSNLRYLKGIEQELDSFAGQLFEQTGKKVVLEVVCNKSLDLNVDNISVVYTKWSRQAAISALERAHIGIMPLDCSEVTLGKAGFKAVQYLGAGLPVVLSPVGFNVEVVEHGKSGYFAENSEEWIKALDEISTCESRYAQMAHSARQRWEKCFNSMEIFQKYSRLFEINETKE